MIPSWPNVLVVDDDENILSAFEEFLRRERCNVFTALDPDAATWILESKPIDLLITDLRLKSQSGIVFFLLAKMKRPSLPVIAVTGYPETAEGRDVLNLGASYYFLKPLDLAKIREAVRECLHLHDGDRDKPARHERKVHPQPPSTPL